MGKICQKFAIGFGRIKEVKSKERGELKLTPNP
jgi:hypothetical protein